uniref:tRNA threonylcarbamoyladenosine biosynthesis protein TsaB n=1 Tax=Candidatus Kentrum sp. LFY TaxID=2126342 RepID=A0A450WXA5_9GAMM|nr:MAG: tRNA threonylcarbamoyl adenosine modification protein YeaZ [Candidatus Kentron sp. LFY]
MNLHESSAMTSILAIDASSDACSVALLLDGEYLESHRLAPRRHAEILLPEIEGLLSRCALSLRDLDGLAFGRGPGAFTGIRIATGVVQGLAFGADLPAVPVSSLQALAQGVWRQHKARSILTAFDARMGEVYWGAYRVDSRNLAAPVIEECVCAPVAIALPDEEGDWFGAGSGWATYGGELGQTVEWQRLGESGQFDHGGSCHGLTGYRSTKPRSTGHRLTGIDPDRYPHARDVATLAVDALERGELVSAEHAQPVYLRNRVTR